MKPFLPLGAAVLLASLGGCLDRPPMAELPRDPAYDFITPDEAAISNTARVFADVGAVAGRPADAALTIAQAERLVVALRTNQRFVGFSPLAQLAFEQAQPEWRSALGIAPAAPPQAVIDQLFAARRALWRADTATAATALASPTFVDGGAAALARLSALPPLPRSAQAATMAQRELYDVGREPMGDR